MNARNRRREKYIFILSYQSVKVRAMAWHQIQITTRWPTIWMVWELENTQLSSTVESVWSLSLLHSSTMLFHYTRLLLLDDFEDVPSSSTPRGPIMVSCFKCSFVFMMMTSVIHTNSNHFDDVWRVQNEPRKKNYSLNSIIHDLRDNFSFPLNNRQYVQVGALWWAANSSNVNHFFRMEGKKSERRGSQILAYVVIILGYLRF